MAHPQLQPQSNRLFRDPEREEARICWKQQCTEVGWNLKHPTTLGNNMEPEKGIPKKEVPPTMRVLPLGLNHYPRLYVTAPVTRFLAAPAAR